MPGMIEYKCPCCGGQVEFDAGTQQMKCPYCDTVFDVEALKNKDEALNQAASDQLDWKIPSDEWSADEAMQMDVYTCKFCGGEIVADENTSATQCPFCGNPVMLSGRLSGGLKPKYVIPFQIDKKQAKEALKKFMGKKKLLPKNFSADNHLDEIKGVYVPFWLFGANANAQVHYKATRTRSWRSGDYRYTETQYYDVFRSGSIAFDHVPVDGSSKIPNEMMESIEPFDFSQARPFQTAFLSGFLADKYDVDAKVCVNRANERIKKSAEDAFRSTVNGYASVTAEHSSVQIGNGEAEYALYPVWLLTTTYEGKQYQFAMNGQTGNFVGNMPMDKGAYWKWRLIWTGILGAASWVVLYLLSYIF